MSITQAASATLAQFDPRRFWPSLFATWRRAPAAPAPVQQRWKTSRLTNARAMHHAL
jgi:hypothetical protein